MTETWQTRRSYDTVADRYTAEFSGELRHKPLDRALFDVVAELAVAGASATSAADRGRPPPT